jgi:hypothetical protein
MDDDRPFTIHSDTKITLSPTAKELAREWQMSLNQFARYLLRQEKLRQQGLIQRDGEN